MISPLLRSFSHPLFLSLLLATPLAAKKPAPHVLAFQKLDSDKNQTLSKAELPEKSQPDFAWADLDQDGTLSPHEYQRYHNIHRRLAESLKTIPEGTKILKNIPYVENGNVRHRLDLYLPPGADQSPTKLPLVLWVHGGGWKNGNKEVLAGQACLLKAGFAIASTNYRLSRTHPFPAQIHDCKAAVRYLRKHAAQHNIDPDRIGIWGSSAGGHLVSLLATTAGNPELEGALGNQDTSSAVQAVCSYFGPSDLFLQASQKGKPNKETPTETIGLFLGGPFAEKHDLARLASPLFHVTKAAPPFLLIHGDADPIVPLAQSTIFHKKLTETGVDSTLKIIPGGIHSFFKEPAQLDLVTHFFRRTLGDPTLGKLTFQDHFERNESQEEKDEPGNGWTTNKDKPWSKGPKQADLKNGALHTTPIDGKETNLLLIRPIDFQDGSIVLRFKFPSEKAQFRVVIADKNLKDVHAGHILSARIWNDKIRLTDMLTGGMDPTLWKKKKDGTLTKEDKSLIRSKTKTFPYQPKPNEWQELRVTIEADQLSLHIDGKQLANFNSPGIAHPKKTILRLAPVTPMVIDDVRIYAKK